VRAFVGYAAAGVADLWLERRDDPAGPIFTGVTSGLALGIRDLRLTDDGVIAAVRWVEFPRGMRWAADPADVLVRDEQVRLLWSDLLRDSDRDGWSDPLERRLHTDPDAADTDEDGLEDPVDPAPRGRSPDPAACGRAEALVAAFAAVFLTEDAEIPVFVVGDESVNLQYEGYGGPVIYLAPEEANTLQEEIGLDGPTCVYLGRPWGCIDPWGRGADYPASEQIAILPGGVEAVVGVAESRGLNNQVARDVLLRCAAGRWHAVEIREMWAG
jgi:hypothetical protein